MPLPFRLRPTLVSPLLVSLTVACGGSVSETASDGSPLMEGTPGGSATGNAGASTATTSPGQGASPTGSATSPTGGAPTPEAMAGSTSMPSTSGGSTAAGGSSQLPGRDTTGGRETGTGGDDGEGVDGGPGEGSGGKPSRQPVAANGASCTTADDCESGVCEGLGCGDDGGTCVSPARPCTRDLVAYCDCDGITFQASGSCPGQRFASEGACAGAGGAGGGGGTTPEGESCVTGEDCESGVCEGLGCGDDNGTCVSLLRACTADLGEYCGCDGETFYGSGSCPGDRYASVGPCPN